jgi:hypothetical protein
MERSDDDRATAEPLTISVGGKAVEVRVLSRRQTREWRALSGRVSRRILDAVEDPEAVLANGGEAALNDDARAELVLAYDNLGGGTLTADDLDDMTPRELARAYIAVSEEADPKGEDRMTYQMMRSFGVAPSQQPSSTPPPPAAGATRHKPSTASRTGR